MQPVMRTIFFTSILAIFGVCEIHAQSIPYLERPVNLAVTDQPIAAVFKSISEQTSVVFSYTLFNDQKKISINCYNKPLRTVLSELLSTSNCLYKVKDKYIIIKCSEDANDPVYSMASGYVYNAVDSSKIDRASIYIEKTKQSSLTNEDGYFIISCPETSPKIVLSIAKADYYDTTITVYNLKESSVVVYLHPRPVKKEIVPVPEPVKSDSSVAEKKDSVYTEQTDFLKKFRKNFKTFNTNFKNITDTLFSGFSVSLIPYISTNRLLSINTVNKYSLNILAGYSKGVDVIEIGGIVNIDDGNVRYLQMAGIGNIVSGKFSGLQMGGIFNINRKRTNGLQIGGIYNEAHSMNGFQVAGILNLTRDHFSGMQISGLINRADTLSGFQLAGWLNDAECVRGVQMSGFINYAKDFRGVQLGFLNFADTCTGAPIGFLSFVTKGYHKIELAADELYFGTLSFGTGSDYFHNIFLGGINLMQSDIWTYGYGIGTGYRIAKKWNICLDGTAQQIQSSNMEISLSLLNRLFLGVEYVPFRKLSIGIGPTYNVMVADVTGDYYQPVADILPATFLYNQTHNDVNVKTWVGAKLSVKFL